MRRIGRVWTMTHWLHSFALRKRLTELRLANLNFTVPVTSVFPQSSAEMLATGVSAAPTSIWNLQGTVGDEPDLVGSNDLTPSSTIMRGRMASGFWDGSDAYSLKCVEFIEGDADYLIAADKNVFNTGLNPFSLLLVARNKHNKAGTRPAVSKYEHSGATPAKGGWILYVTATTFQIYLFDDDGSFGSWAFAHGMADQAWHPILFVRDAPDDWDTYTDEITDHRTWTQFDSFLNDGIFTIGYNTTLGVGAGSLQICYAAFFENVALGRSDIDAFWASVGLGTDPTGLLTTKTRASACAEVIDSNAGSLVLCDYVDDSVVLGYNAGLTNAKSVGLRCNTAQSTLLTESDDLIIATWTVTNAWANSVQSSWGVSPRGCLSCMPLIALADNGYTEHSYVTTELTEYSHSVMLAGNGGAVTGRVIAHDKTHNVEIDSQVFSLADAVWQRVDLTFTTPAACVSVGFRIEIDTNGQSLFMFRATAKAGKPGLLIYANGATATAAASDFEATAAAGAYCWGATGRLVVTALADYEDAATVPRYLTDIHRAADDVDRRALYLNADEEPTLEVYDDAGALDHTTASAVATDPTAERDFEGTWDNTVLSRIKIDALTTNESSDTWDATSLTTSVEVGQDKSAANQFDGLIAKIRIFDHDAQAITELSGEASTDLVLEEPTVQPLPITALGVSTLIGRTPSTIYDFEETAGNPIVDRLGATSNLSLYTYQRNPFQEQKAIGLWDGSSLSTKKAIEFYILAGGRVYSPNTTDHDETTGSFAWAVMCRTNRLSSLVNFFGKRTTSTGSGAGWIALQNSGGQMIMRIDDGVSQAQLTSNPDAMGGEWNLFFFVVDRSTNEMVILNQNEESTRIDISSIGNLTNGDVFHIGAHPTSGLGSNAVQIAWMAKFSGAQAEGLQVSDVQLLWNHAMEPTGLLSFTRDSYQAEIVGSDAGGPYLAEYGPGQFPMGYNAGWSHTSKLAYRPTRTLTNLITSSDVASGSGWTYSNVTFRKFGFDNTYEESPRHMYECGVLLAGADNGYAESSPFAVTESTVYTSMLFYKRSDSMGSDVAGAWIAWDKIADAQIGLQAITATAAWQVLTYTFTTPAGCTSAAMRLRIDLNTKRLTAFRMVVCEGEIAAPILTMGTAATMDATVLQLASVHGNRLRSDQGEIEATFLADNASLTGLQQVLVDGRHGTSDTDRCDMRVLADETLQSTPYDNADTPIGPVVSAAYAWNQERVLITQWYPNDEVPLSAGDKLANSVDGTVVGGVAAAWPYAKNAIDVVSIGSDGAATPANQPVGGISRVKLFLTPRP
jgi:hypothetical protein